MANRYKVTSHEGFSHDSLDALAYDWERIANPAILPKAPFKAYFPLTTDDVVKAVRELHQLGQSFKIRSKGHSSNDLVLEAGGAVVCMQNMTQIIGIDDVQKTVTVQAGVVLAELDDILDARGLGLPIIGDHNHITAGGFAAVGGISPASHKFGMFVDNVRSIELVTATGEVRTLSRESEPRELYRVLGGTGQYGVVTTLTLDVIHVDKYDVVLKNDRRVFTGVDAFLKESTKRIIDPGTARMERGLWLDYQVLGQSLTVGQFSSYVDTRQTPVKKARNAIEYAYLHALGDVAGRLPVMADNVVKALGVAGIVLSPRYASMKNIETFTDRVIDSSVGDPTRMFIALAPANAFRVTFQRLYDLFREYRKTYGCFTFVSIYVKAIESPYLAAGGRGAKFSELMVYCGIVPTKLNQDVLESLVSRMDDICIAEGAYRYMHSRTVKDPERRRLIDPNTAFQGDAGTAGGATLWDHTSHPLRNARGTVGSN